MYRAITLSLLVSGWANALTLSPMYKQELVYRDLYKAVFQLENTSPRVVYYDVWVTLEPSLPPPKDWMYGLFKGEEVLGGNSYKQMTVPVFNIKPDKLETYFVCVQERPEKEKLSVVGKACAKLELYWPLAELRKLQ